jgi:hypothetical protein
MVNKNQKVLAKSEIAPFGWSPAFSKFSISGSIIDSVKDLRPSASQLG